jgi:hypothetical protein
MNCNSATLITINVAAPEIIAVDDTIGPVWKWNYWK